MYRSRGLIIMSGECFRDGGQWSRLRDTEQSLEKQKVATDSHIAFFNKILESSDIDIYLNTYRTKYNKELEEWYNIKNMTINYVENLDPGGPSSISTSCLKKLNIDHYDWIFCFRPDLKFKPYFINKIFSPEWDHLMYPCRMWLLWLFIDNGFINVNDTMLFCPKKLFNIIINGGLQLYHDGLYKYINQYNLDKNDFNFMINTLHDSDSFKDYNPLYTMVSRPENKYWYSYGYEVDQTDKYQIYLTDKNYTFEDWNLLDGNILQHEKINIKNLDNVWEWWHQDDKTIKKFHNLIELYPISIFHGQRVGLSRHNDQTYWDQKSDQILMYHSDFRHSTTFQKINDYVYDGRYEFDASIKFMLRKFHRP